MRGQEQSGRQRRQPLQTARYRHYMGGSDHNRRARNLRAGNRYRLRHAGGHQLQTAADNAALAAAAQVQTSTTAASNAAVTTASANTCLGSAVALTPATDVVCGNYNSSSGVFTGNTTPYNAVQVTCKRVAARSKPGQSSLRAHLSLHHGRRYAVVHCPGRGTFNGRSNRP